MMVERDVRVEIGAILLPGEVNLVLQKSNINMARFRVLTQTHK